MFYFSYRKTVVFVETLLISALYLNIDALIFKFTLDVYCRYPFFVHLRFNTHQKEGDRFFYCRVDPFDKPLAGFHMLWRRTHWHISLIVMNEIMFFYIFDVSFGITKGKEIISQQNKLSSVQKLFVCCRKHLMIRKMSNEKIQSDMFVRMMDLVI